MKQRVGTCTNVGYCENADSNKKIPLIGTSTCPICGGDLYEVSSSSSLSNKLIIFGALIAVLLLVVGAIIWNGGPPYPPEPQITSDEIRVVLPKVLNNAEIQTSVDIALTKKVNEFAKNSYVNKAINLYYGQWQDKLTINLANAKNIKVTEEQYPWLHQMVSQAANALDIKMPHTYLVFAESPNAYVTNVTEPVLVIHSGLIEIMSPPELLFVIGHELGHIKFKHVLAHEIVGISYNAINQIVPTETLRAIIAKGILFTFLKWSREAEISADRMGMILVGSEEIASKALIKLISGLDDKYGQINIEAFIKQKSKAENAAFDLTKIPVLLKEATSTHPFIGSRVEALYQYQNSSEYTKLFSAGDNHQIKIRLPTFE